jgi:hypothetical protein
MGVGSTGVSSISGTDSLTYSELTRALGHSATCDEVLSGLDPLRREWAS